MKNYSLKNTVVTICVIGAMFAILFSCQQREGPAERAGKKVDNVAEKVGDKIEKTGEKIKDAAKDKKK
jgi:hypothetical protein